MGLNVSGIGDMTEGTPDKGYILGGNPPGMGDTTGGALGILGRNPSPGIRDMTEGTGGILGVNLSGIGDMTGDTLGYWE